MAYLQFDPVSIKPDIVCVTGACGMQNVSMNPCEDLFKGGGGGGGGGGGVGVGRGCWWWWCVWGVV